MHTVFVPNATGDHVIVSRTDEGDDHTLRAKSLRISIDPLKLDQFIDASNSLAALLEEQKNFFSLQASMQQEVAQREYHQRKVERIQEVLDNYKRNRA